MAIENGYHPGEKAANAIARLEAQAAREPEEPAVIAGYVPAAEPEQRWTVRACVSDLSDMWRERNHLRAQRDDLQALNTRLHNQRIAANNERISAEERATSLQMRVNELTAAVADWRKRAEADREAIDAAKRDAALVSEIRRALGAASAEHVVEAAKRVVAERDEAAAKAQRERERANEFLVQFHDANKRADAAERLAHEAEAQREAAVRDAANAKLASYAAPLDLSGVCIDHVDVPVRRVGAHSLPLPAYAKPGDAGMDLRSLETLVVPPGGRVFLGCGFAFAIPNGYEGQVRPRSRLSKQGIVGTLGTIDSGYRGEVVVVLTNASHKDFAINAGDRIAQIVFAPCARATLREVDALDETERGSGAFGSTGVR